MHKGADFVFPARQNNFLGYGSLEAFVLNNIEKLTKQPKKGAFKIAIDTADEDTDTNVVVKRTAWFLIRDLRVEGDCVSFFNLYLTRGNADVDENGSHLPRVDENENMLEYFDRLQTQNNGYWVEHHIYQPYAVRIYGQFAYTDGGGVLNDWCNKFAEPFDQSAPRSRKFKTVAPEKEEKAEIISLSLRRDTNDKPDKH